MKNDDVKKIVIGILIICIIIMVCFSIYFIFFKLEKIENSVVEMIEPKEKIVNTFEHLVGTYGVDNEKARRKLIILDNGDGEYYYEEKCNNDDCIKKIIRGKIGIGKNRIYLFNDEYKIDSNNNGISLIEFDYNDDLIMIDKLVLQKLK